MNETAAGLRAGPFLVVGGASKSGTTALYFQLAQHPGFFLPEKKELHYFSRPAIARRCAGPGDRYVLAEMPATPAEYLAHYAAAPAGVVPVDVSPSYLAYPETAEQVRDFFAQPRLVFILRNPVEKAYSQYLHLVGEGRETLAFEAALAAEAQRKADGFLDMWLYRDSGFYAQAVAHFIEVLGRDRVQVHYYDEYMADPARVLAEICRFAGVDPGFAFQPVHDINRSGAPRSLFISRLLLMPNPLTFLLRRIVPAGLGRRVRGWIKQRNTGAKPDMSAVTRARLLDDYRADILRLEQLLGRPSGWLPRAD